MGVREVDCGKGECIEMIRGSSVDRNGAVLGSLPQGFRSSLTREMPSPFSSGSCASDAAFSVAPRFDVGADCESMSKKNPPAGILCRIERAVIDGCPCTAAKSSTAAKHTMPTVVFAISSLSSDCGVCTGLAGL